MAFTQETITHHKDAGKHSGTAAERIAKEVGLGKYSKKIGAFVSKFVGKKQKAMMDNNATANAQGAPAAIQIQPTATTAA